MSNLSAVDRMLESVGSSDDFAAEVELARGLAGQVDLNPDDANLWREYRMALKALREAMSGDDSVDAPVVDLLARLGRTHLRDAAEN